MKRNEWNLFGIILMILGLILLFVISPWIAYWMSYCGGWIASLVIGDTLCGALNTLFDTNRFTPDLLPRMAGALGWIGSFFKNVNMSTKKK